MGNSRCGYQDQDAKMTLREGIEEYRGANPHLLLPASTDEEAAEFFRCHDRIHVVFGCDTSFLHEVRTDFWTFFGSDVGIVKYASYLGHPAIKLLLKDLKEKAARNPAIRKNLKAELKSSAGRALLTPLQVFARARKMNRKWPWRGSEELLDRPLKEIRDDFGIRVFD